MCGGLDFVCTTDYNLFDDLKTGQESLGWIWKSDLSISRANTHSLAFPYDGVVSKTLHD
jgi:hypothetical protein